MSKIASVGEPPAIFLFTDLDKYEDVAHDMVPARLTATLGSIEPKSVEVSTIFSCDGPLPTIDDDTSPQMKEWNIESMPGGFKMFISSYGANVETGFHATNTFDIDIVISGEMFIIAEDGIEVRLTEGDSVVIPGVVHAWRSGPAGCRVAFLMSGRP